MLKVFISQPMSGKEATTIDIVRAEAIKTIRQHYPEEDLQIIDSHFQKHGKPLECLGDAIKLMADANIIYFCKNWEHSRGCLIEHACAELYMEKADIIEDTDDERIWRVK